MKKQLLRFILFLCPLFVVSLPAATLYVDVNSPGPAAPYSTWATAAATIQDAVDASAPGDLVLVTNGVYQTGGHPVAPLLLTNRVAVTNAITIQSVNGPSVTSIAGNPVLGVNAVRCVYLTNGASLIGFTVTGGATRTSGNASDQMAGGVWCFSTNSIVSNCVIVGNQSRTVPGGDSSGVLETCRVAANSPGGVSGAVLFNCTVVSNSAPSGTVSSFAAAGVSSCTLYNSLVAYNTATTSIGTTTAAAGAANSKFYNCNVIGNVMNAPFSGVASGGLVSCSAYNSIVYSNVCAGVANNSSTDGQHLSSFFNCCTTTSSANGSGSTFVAAAPELVDLYHLASNSPCIGTGNPAYSLGTDIDGESWRNPPSIGCDEYNPGGALTVSIAAISTNIPANFELQLSSQAIGSQSSNIWNFGDGTYATNTPVSWHAWAAPGDYTVSLTVYNANHPSGVIGLLPIHATAQTVHYVNASNGTPVAPYLSWATAATNIQDAVDAASGIGDLVLVTNGVYQFGGRVAAGKALLNRVLVTNMVAIQSVNGPAVTTIAAQGSGSRCAYLTDGASLVGFTMFNGNASLSSDFFGGGIYCTSLNCYISNCVITSNTASAGGGGVNGGTYFGCIIASNTAPNLSTGGGANQCALNDCTIFGNSATSGGGVNISTVNNCLVVSNTTAQGTPLSIFGGGTAYSSVNNSTLAYNSTSTSGGGSAHDTLHKCLLIGNLANTNQFSSGNGGGAYASILYGCTLSNNISSSGGAAYGALLADCMVTENFAAQGAINACTVRNSLIVSNSILPYFSSGGESGAMAATLYNCTVYGNSSSSGGFSALNCTLYNSIVFSNLVFFGSSPIPALGNDYNNCVFSNSCAPNLPATSGNISSPPLFVDLYHLDPASPCRGAGNAAFASGLTLDGQPWLNPPSMGCQEYYAGGPLTVAASAASTNLAAGFQIGFNSQIFGSRSSFQWDFGDGNVVTNILSPTHLWTAPGTYFVTLTAWNQDHPSGVTSTLIVQIVPQPVLYVDVNSANPVAPYLSWAAAATNIQDAVDAATVDGSLVLVTNGTYSVGGRFISPYLTSNRLIVSKPLVIQSVAGPGATIIQGSRAGGGSNVRCAYLTNWSWLIGFTLTNGSPRGSGDTTNELSGGGVLCSSVNAFVSNCIITGNSAVLGGGVSQGTYFNCTILSNTAQYGAGASGSAWYNSVFPTLIISNSIIAGNHASSTGGGVSGGKLMNTVITGNSAPLSWPLGWGMGVGGGAQAAQIFNCTVSSNVASVAAGLDFCNANNSIINANVASTVCGGVMGGFTFNCTIVSNVAPSQGGVADDPGFAPPTLIDNSIVCSNSGGDYGVNSVPPIVNFSCIPTLPNGAPGIGAITNDPLFVDFLNGNFHLQSNSPCINAGNNAYLTNNTVDLDGNPRVAGGTVDIGAYEFQNPGSILSYAWLQQYGLPTDGSADNVDSDGDGMSNWQEWRAGTNPTNAASLLQLAAPMPSGSNAVVTWQSAPNVSYYLQRSANLAPGSFLPLATNIPGQLGTTSYTDTNSFPGPWFYRVGVQ